MSAGTNPSAPQKNKRPDSVEEILWETALEAFVQATLILVMGHIALAIVGGILHDMIPSEPPVLFGASQAETDPAQHTGHWHLPAVKYQFGIVFSAVFLVLTSVRLLDRFRRGWLGKRSRWRRAGRRFSEDWFTLIVSNAFTAMIAAMVLAWTQQFSWTLIVWHWVEQSILPDLHSFSVHVFGDRTTDTLGRVIKWYGANQLKFDFWVIYVASVCDDLGLPNLKTLVRSIWRRVRKRKRNRPPAPAAATEQAL